MEHINNKYTVTAIVEIDKLGRPGFVLTADGKTVSQTHELIYFKNDFGLIFSKSVQSIKPM